MLRSNNMGLKVLPIGSLLPNNKWLLILSLIISAGLQQHLVASSCISNPGGGLTQITTWM